MQSLRKLLVHVGCAMALAATGAATAVAQDYPARPIQIVVPYSAGGGAEVAARMVGNALSKALNQSVIVEARPGGATVPGTTHVARSAPDGYTLLLTGGSSMVLVPLTFQGTLPYDPAKDFEPIGMVSRIPLFIAVPASSPYQTLDDLLKDAKARPGAVSYGHNGVGSLAHLAGELLAQRAGVQLNAIPYKSFSVAAPDLATGRVDMLMTDLAGINPLLQDKSVRLLGVTSTERSPFREDVPTVAESGFPGYSMEVWLAIFAPAGTPKDTVQLLTRQVSETLKTPEAVEALAKLGHIADPSGGDVVKQRIQNETQSLKPIVGNLGLK